MGDKPLDDTKPSAPPLRKREPGAYYYDDQTGYEPYDPSLHDGEDEDEKEDDARPETTGPT